MGFWICATCAVEHAERVEVCAICADERQWVPAEGQRWTTLEELAAEGRSVEVAELEPDLFGITATPKAGIGQTAKLVRTPSGNLLWDPIGFVDAEGVARVRELGGAAAIVASHPHMFGVQVEWSRALGGVAGARRRGRPGVGGAARTRSSRRGPAPSRSCPASP